MKFTLCQVFLRKKQPTLLIKIAFYSKNAILNLIFISSYLMAQNLMYLVISLLATGFLRMAGVGIYRVIFLHMQRNHRKQQASEIRFLQVQIPKNAVARSSDIDAKDHIQSMKQNIELMNQVYKNFYAIFD